MRKFVSDEQFSFEKLAAQCPPLLKTGQRQISPVPKRLFQAKKLLAIKR
jgi:hypothetical protein